MIWFILNEKNNFLARDASKGNALSWIYILAVSARFNLRILRNKKSKERKKKNASSNVFDYLFKVNL